MTPLTSRRLHRLRTQMILVAAALTLILALPRILWGAKIETPPKLGTIYVQTLGITSSEGRIRAALYKEESFLSADKFVEGIIRKPVTGNIVLMFSDIPYGTYAIALYHDENNNDKFDKSTLGIPKEPYGFSNNVKPKLSAPAFQKAAFIHSNPTTNLNITLIP